MLKNYIYWCLLILEEELDKLIVLIVSYRVPSELLDSLSARLDSIFTLESLVRTND